MNQRTPASAIDARWPVVLAILTLLVLLVALPDRIRLVPMWVHCGIVGVFLMPIVAVGLTAGRAPWPRIERTTTFAFCVVVAISASVNLGYLLGEMLVRSDGVSGMQLLTSSIGLWATNVVNFSVLYWQVDGGGPEARRSPAGRLAGFRIGSFRMQVLPSRCLSAGVRSSSIICSSDSARRLRLARRKPYR